MINEKMGQVSFGQAFKDFFKGYVDFRGRSTRAGYWWMQLWLIPLWIGLGAWALIKIFLDLIRQFQGAHVSSYLPLVITLAVFGVGLFLPTLALQIRRYRDVGLRGRGSLVLWLITDAIEALRYFALMRQLQAATVFRDPNLLAPAGSRGVEVVLTVITIGISGFFFVLTLLPSDVMTTTSTNRFVRFFIRGKQVASAAG